MMKTSLMKQPKEKWPAQKVYQRISLVKQDVSELNRTMNAIDGERRRLLFLKRDLQNKISKKNKYLNKLNEQLKEVLCQTSSGRTSTLGIQTS